MPGVFPPLVGNPAVTANDPTKHMAVVLNGLSGQAINGTSYAAQMPAFGAQLSDAEIADIIDHERTSWGNHAPTVTAKAGSQWICRRTRCSLPRAQRPRHYRYGHTCRFDRTWRTEFHCQCVWHRRPVRAATCGVALTYTCMAMGAVTRDCCVVGLVCGCAVGTSGCIFQHANLYRRNDVAASGERASCGASSQ